MTESTTKSEAKKAAPKTTKSEAKKAAPKTTKSEAKKAAPKTTKSEAKKVSVVKAGSAQIGTARLEGIMHGKPSAVALSLRLQARGYSAVEADALAAQAVS